jgi:tetratricopeptide (TPR) repeat protein
MRAWAAGMQATILLWAGRPQEAVERIDAGLASAPRGSPRVRLLCIQGRAWARLGSHADTEKALAACRTERERAGGGNELHDHVGGEFGFTEARQAFCSGSAYLQLGNVSRALEECERAVRLYEASPAGERWYGAECSARTDLAAARLLRGELDGAREALAPVFALPPDKRVQGVVKRLGNVQRLLSQPLYLGSAEGRHLGQQIEGFAAGAVSRALPGAAVPLS